MDEDTKKKVKATVLEILRGADMESVTEYKIRSAAADRLGVDLSVPDRKLFVRGVVENYLRSLPSKEDKQQQEEEDDAPGEEGEEKDEEEEEDEEDEDEDEEEEEEEEEKGTGNKKKREYDEQGDLILCRLSARRRVTLSEFKGRTLVSIREFYLKDGKEVPSAKGISLTVEQWEAFCNAVPAIDDAIKKIEED